MGGISEVASIRPVNQRRRAFADLRTVLWSETHRLPCAFRQLRFRQINKAAAFESRAGLGVTTSCRPRQEVAACNGGGRLSWSPLKRIMFRVAVDDHTVSCLMGLPPRPSNSKASVAAREVPRCRHVGPRLGDLVEVDRVELAGLFGGDPAVAQARRGSGRRSRGRRRFAGGAVTADFLQAFGCCHVPQC